MFHFGFHKQKTLFLSLSALSMGCCSLSQTSSPDTVVITPTATATNVHLPSATQLALTKKKIKIALLLDTSGSMDGLIDQARAQLWKLVNELAKARYNNEKPGLELALYEYGSAVVSAEAGYLRQLSDFTNDLDVISEKLFSLHTSGSEEYCGQVIAAATNQLNWENNNEDLQIIFIAGNEAFTQGKVNYSESCKSANQKNIFVNTIYCGNYNEGLNSGWKNGATLAHGNYMSIEQNQKTVYIETPYDTEIAGLNDKLNETYVSYGYEGNSKKLNQIAQDNNARKYGTVNTASRVLTKSSKFYDNTSWDMVDASRKKDFDVQKIKESDLPAVLKGKSKEEKEKYIASKTKEREEITKHIEELNKLRNEYLTEKARVEKTADNSLDAAMLKAIHEQAAQKNLKFESASE